MGLGKMTSVQSLTWICTNKTISWLVHSLSTFDVRTNHGQIQTHKTRRRLDLGEPTTFPLIVFYVPLPEAHIQMAFYPGIPKWEFRNSHNWDSRNFAGP
jgi:hypothetical protein